MLSFETGLLLSIFMPNLCICCGIYTQLDSLNGKVRTMTPHISNSVFCYPSN